MIPFYIFTNQLSKIMALSVFSFAVSMSFRNHMAIQKQIHRFHSSEICGFVSINYLSVFLMLLCPFLYNVTLSTGPR